MLHVKDSLFSMVRRYTPWGNFGSEVMGNLARGDGRLGSKVMGTLAQRCAIPLGVTWPAVSSILWHFHYIFAGPLAISSTMIFQRRMKPSPL